MKKTFLFAIASIALLNSCEDKSSKPSTANPGTTDTATVVQEEKPARVKPDSATQMKNWFEYMTPGPMHQMLASTNGNWTGAVTMWESPEAPPTTSTLSATYKMVLGGRYQQVTHSGTMMGMPFEGTSTTGYDNAKKKFINTWIDNSGTGIMYLEGTWDEGNKSITFTGKCVAAEMGDGSEMGVKQVMTFTDATHHEFTMYMVDEEGKETKTMEIKYTKK